MSTGQYLLGGAAGLVFGLLVAAGNTLLGYSADVIKGGAATGGTKAAGAGTINVTIG